MNGQHLAAGLQRIHRHAHQVDGLRPRKQRRRARGFLRGDAVRCGAIALRIESTLANEAAWLAGEDLGWHKVLGGILIVSASLLESWQARRESQAARQDAGREGTIA